MRSLEDKGHAIESLKPFRPSRRAYEPGKLPDPVQCAGCLIIVNNPNDSGRLRLAISDGSSWQYFRLERDDVGSSNVPTIDVERLAAEVTNRAIAQMPNPAMKVIAPSGNIASDDLQAVAQGVLENATHLQNLAQQCADLMDRVEFLERHVFVKTKLVKDHA